MTLRPNAWSPQVAARIAGAAYLLTNVTAESSLFFVLPRLVVAGDVARTVSNIAVHTTLFRVAILLDLLTIAGCVILNVALYELLAPVHRSLARLAAFWRLVESAVYASATVCKFVILSMLGGAAYLQVFEPRQLQALARLFMSANSYGFWIAMWFLALGSAIYSYLLVRSRYIPKLLALSGVVAGSLAVCGILAWFVFPTSIAITVAAVRALPIAALGLIAMVLVPIFSFEFTIGAWLLVKGVRVPEGM